MKFSSKHIGIHTFCKLTWTPKIVTVKVNPLAVFFSKRSSSESFNLKLGRIENQQMQVTEILPYDLLVKQKRAKWNTLQGTNISHLWKKKIIFKMPWEGIC